MKRNRREELEINADAFLDTVANLVGILVILVVVVTSQSKMAATAAVKDELERQNVPTPQAAESLEAAANVQRDIERQLRQLQQHELQLAARDAERDSLMLHVVAQSRANEEAIGELDDQSQEELANRQELDRLQKQIAALLRQQGDLEAAERPEQLITLQHLPTPMAKTVFGEEVHLLLQGNKLSLIPWDTLVGTLKKQAGVAASRGLQNGRLVDTLGPIDGFIMKYALQSQRGMITNGRTVAMAQSVELDYFVLEPTAEVRRETLEQTLATGGRLRTELAMHSPRGCTVTVWVYPDSFATFRELKNRLYAEGYLTAARPLPEGIRVGASPRGSSSTAQ